ncbi:hypothetical protein DPMN_133241 [Dreissena polymorpha]|uniref:Uncharacterized protein n=1 Tax=Dreissena polymorpha TaxID=45954 RepID=A0A9D4JCS0_DREPO|nr:hypothetical protein DPMN_133241 [Dreissena polymorpha]
MSRTTRNIYLNEACARCNGDDDIEAWYFAADIAKPLNPFMTSMLTTANIKDVIENGVFTPPPSVDVSNLACIETSIGDKDDVIFPDLNFHDTCSFLDNPFAYNQSVFQIIQCETCGACILKFFSINRRFVVTRLALDFRILSPS